MKNKNLHIYSIMRLDVPDNKIDEVVEDIKYQYENGIAFCPLFSMTLVPEGNPPVDKVGTLCKKYLLFKEKLDKLGVPNGVLVQATLGHGWTLGQMFPYQQYIGLKDGVARNTVCPTDLGFRDYIYNVFKTIAKCNPDAMMVDDDFRLLQRAGFACGCPNHIKIINDTFNVNLTREELAEIISKDDETSKKYLKVFVESQQEALIETAKIMRKGIDEVNPDIPCAFCCGGYNAQYDLDIAKVLAGKGKTILRINNGSYSHEGTRYFTYSALRAARQTYKFKDKIDILLGETDTCPQNRYSTTAVALHNQFTNSILEGCGGAKQWITRGPYEPESGKAYRKILSENCGFYEQLFLDVKDIEWQGARTYLSRDMDLPTSNESSAWGHFFFEAMGIPYYFSGDKGGVVCLEGKTIESYPIEEIKEILSGNVILSSDVAELLIKLGLQEYIGVDVRAWKGKTIKGEYIVGDKISMGVQPKAKELVPLSDKVEVLSNVFNSDYVNTELLFPGVTKFENSLGGTIVTFAGTPNAGHFIDTGCYAFLNQTRKSQVVSIMKGLDCLPVYYPGDAEVYVKAGKLKSGELMVVFTGVSADIIENIELCFDKQVSKIEMLMPNGERKELSFKVENGVYTLDESAYPLKPVILYVK